MTDERPRIFHLFGNLVKFLAYPDDTGGRCTIIEITTVPGAGAPPNHHAGEDESFYVLDGRFDFMLNGETISAAPGDFVKIPDGAVHAFTCTGDRPGKLLQVNAPGTAHEMFFTEIGEAMPDGTTDIPPSSGPPDMAHIMAVSAKAGMTVVVPEGAPA